MPELATPTARGITVSPFTPQSPSSYFDRTPPPAPIVDTTAVSGAAGKSALYGSIAKVLAELPDKLQASYESGRKLATGNAIQSRFNTALQSGTGLSDFSATSDGTISFKPGDPTLDAAKVAYYNRLGQAKPKTTTPSLWEKEMEALGVKPSTIKAPVSAPDGTTSVEPDLPEADTSSDPGSELGMIPPAQAGALAHITDYGQTNDPYGDSLTRAGKSAIGQLGPDSMAASRDVEAQMAQKGIKIGDHVRLTMSDGSTVDRVFDDRTAKGLTGRVDLYTPGTQANPLRDAGVVSIDPAAAVPTADRQAIAGAATNIGQQLAGIEPAEAGLDAANVPGAVPSAPITPVSRAQALATFGATQPAAPAEAATGHKTVDQTTGIITMESPDGKRYQLLPYAKAWKEVKAAPEAKIPTALQVEMARSGYDYSGQTPKEAIAGWRKHLNETESIAPHLLPSYTAWRNRLKNTDPLVKQYYTAKHEANAIESSLSGGLTPAAALGAIDGFIKAMRGGAATQGMTKILEEGQTLSQNLKLKWQKLTGGASTNAVLTPEMASDIQKIVGRIKAAAESEIQDQKEGDKEYWQSIGVPANAVEKAYKGILSERRTSVDPAGEQAPAPASQDTEAAAWLKANPNHPKAAAVRAALAAKGIAE